MARGWRRGAEWLLARSGFAEILRRFGSPSTAILAYHNIVPKGEPVAGDISLHVDQAAFADQLDFLTERHDIVPLGELRVGSEPANGRSRVVLTFDDAYEGALTAGVEELRARGLPATVFVPPGLLGGDGFWWDRLAPPMGGPLAPTVRSHALEKLEGQQESIISWAAEQGLPISDLPPHARPASEETLLETGNYELLHFGVHTWSHPNLARVSPSLVRSELDRSSTWLQARAPRYTDWFAYPYGLRTESVVGEVADHFEGAVLIEGGLAQARGHWLANQHALPRINVSRGLSIDGLNMRLAGLLQ